MKKTPSHPRQVAVEPETPRRIHSYSHPEPDRELLRVGRNAYRIVDENGSLDLDAPGAVEFILQQTLPLECWQEFAAFMPTLYPAAGSAQGSEALNVRAEFTGGAAGAILAAAESTGRSPEGYIHQTVCAQFCSHLADATTPEEAPDISCLFAEKPTVPTSRSLTLTLSPEASAAVLEYQQQTGRETVDIASGILATEIINALNEPPHGDDKALIAAEQVERAARLRLKRERKEASAR